MEKESKGLISTVEAAKLMGISRVSVFRKIKKGEIKATKIGRNYVVDKRSLGDIYQDLTEEQRRKVVEGVKKAVEDYGEALKRLGTE